MVQRGDFTVAIACVPCGPRRSLIYAWAWWFCVCWKLSAAEQVKRDCCHTPAVVSTLLTPLPVSCPLTTPHHYIKIKAFASQSSPSPPRSSHRAQLRAQRQQHSAMIEWVRGNSVIPISSAKAARPARSDSDIWRPPTPRSSKAETARTTQRAAREPLQPVQKSSDGVVSIVW